MPAKEIETKEPAGGSWLYKAQGTGHRAQGRGQRAKGAEQEPVGSWQEKDILMSGVHHHDDAMRRLSFVVDLI